VSFGFIPGDIKTHYVIIFQYVAKPYEVPIKKVEFVVEKTGCKNSFGNDVPCRKSKREAQEVIDTPVEIPVETPVVTPVVYNSPIAYNTPLGRDLPIFLQFFYLFLSFF
jgi:hypothetical protein